MNPKMLSILCLLLTLSVCSVGVCSASDSGSVYGTSCTQLTNKTACLNATYGGDICGWCPNAAVCVTVRVCSLVYPIDCGEYCDVCDGSYIVNTDNVTSVLSTVVTALTAVMLTFNIIYFCLVFIYMSDMSRSYMPSDHDPNSAAKTRIIIAVIIITLLLSISSSIVLVHLALRTCNSTYQYIAFYTQLATFCIFVPLPFLIIAFLLLLICARDCAIKMLMWFNAFFRTYICSCFIRAYYIPVMWVTRFYVWITEKCGREPNINVDEINDIFYEEFI